MTDADAPHAGIHHVAYATRDTAATVHFYEDLLGFPLVHTEMEGTTLGYMRHLFFDTGGGECIAFFELHRMGERRDFATDLSETNGVPVWVNHIAFKATSPRQERVREAMAAAGIEPLMEVDHGWCHSLYFLDPNGIMVELCRDTPGLPIEPDAAHATLHAEPAEPVAPAGA